MSDDVRNDYMLVRIEPPLIGQSYGLGGADTIHLILATRHQGYTLFPVTEWPCHVYILAPLNENTMKHRLTFAANEVERIAWGMIWQKLADIPLGSMKCPA